MHFSLQNRRELKSRRHSAGFIDGKKMKCSDLAWGTRCLGKDLFSEQNWSRFLFPSLSISFSLSPFFRSGETDMRFRICARPRNPARSIYRPCAARFRESLTDYNGSERITYTYDTVNKLPLSSSQPRLAIQNRLALQAPLGHPT